MNFNHLINIIIIFPLLMIIGIIAAKKFNIVDKPSNRKIHETKIPNVTGVIIFVYLLLIVSNTEFSSLIEQIIIASFAVVLTGFIDDRKEIEPLTKIFFLLFPSGYLILNGFELTDLGQYEYFGLIYLGKFSVIFTFLAVILLINSINYIDGIDGLLIGYTLTALLYFYFLSENQNQYLQLFLIFIIILTISLIFNFLPTKSGLKSFLGDSGSLFIGFFISFVMIFLYKYQNIHPAFLIWSCWLPIYDFLYVTINRIVKKKDFSNPDKSHLHHHIFEHFSKSHFKAFLAINIFNIIIICIGYVVTLFIGKTHSLILFILFFLLFVLMRLKFQEKI